MQLRHVTTNLRQGLRRNLTMHVAVVLTLFVSLSLLGVGLMVSQQAGETGKYLGNQLQITVYLCVPDDPNAPQCTSEVTGEQRQAVEDVIEANPEVASYYFESKETAFEKVKDIFGSERFEGRNAVLTADDLNESFWITLKDPDRFEGITSALTNLDGVSSVRDLRQEVGPIYAFIDTLKYVSWAAAGALVLAAVLLVANTIRLAALARRKEIEIMRLVGASGLLIVLPFVLESVVTALIGVALAGGVLAAFTQFGIIDGLAERLDFTAWIGWGEFWQTFAVIAVVGPLIAVVPTLLLTRKYIRV